MENKNIFIKGNVFKGRITRIEPSLEAAFVDFGAERHGFLPLNQIECGDKEKYQEGDALIVSITKVAYGQKGAVLKSHKEVPSGVTIHELSIPGNNSIIKKSCIYIMMLLILGFILTLVIRV